MDALSMLHNIVRAALPIFLISAMSARADVVCQPPPPKNEPLSDFFAGPHPMNAFPSERAYIEEVRKHTSACDFKTLRYTYVKYGDNEHFIIFHKAPKNAWVMIYNSPGTAYDQHSGDIKAVMNEGETWKSEASC